MRGKKFATSKDIVIYVRDTLERYQVDALRYFISMAGPESQDADFTQAEFMRRTNGELVTAWGNLVNRTAAMVSERFGEIPLAGELEGTDQELLGMVATGFDTVGGLIEAHHQKAALGEVMRLVGEANRCAAQTEPFKLKDESQRSHLGTILHALTQVVTDSSCMMSPFSPTSCNTIDRILGGEGNIAPIPRIEEVVDSDVSSNDGSPRTYPVIAGDYTDTPTWERHPVMVGQKVAKPVPIFEKLDESVVDEEIVRYADLLGR